VDLFGAEILHEDHTINRDKLGGIVFDDLQLLQELNQITHPRVMEHFKQILQTIKADQPDAVVFIEVPLLYETHMERICDEVWVIWVDEEIQIERLIKRDSLGREDAIKRIDAQMNLDEKAKRANVVIDNRHSMEETIETATRYYKTILGQI